MEEKIITCIHCGNQFALTAAQQERLRAAGFTEPKCCKDCRKNKVKTGLSRHEMKLKYKRKQSRFHLDQ
ncbi:MAG: zinc-ribbon domain containing protein [Deltaproteobacteria bacterium]|nr:MAG: zinc-ribbon domain containing protein [Deltaproteobacteria bacterium]